MPNNMVLSKGMILVYEGKEGKPVLLGDETKVSTGEKVWVRVGTSPVHSGSTGRVYVEYEEGTKMEYYPSVCKMKWVRLSKVVARRLNISPDVAELGVLRTLYPGESR